MRCGLKLSECDVQVSRSDIFKTQLVERVAVTCAGRTQQQFAVPGCYRLCGCLRRQCCLRVCNTQRRQPVLQCPFQIQRAACVYLAQPINPAARQHRVGYATAPVDVAPRQPRRSQGIAQQMGALKPVLRLHRVYRYSLAMQCQQTQQPCGFAGGGLAGCAGPWHFFSYGRRRGVGLGGAAQVFHGSLQGGVVGMGHLRRGGIDQRAIDGKRGFAGGLADPCVCVAQAAGLRSTGCQGAKRNQCAGPSTGGVGLRGVHSALLVTRLFAGCCGRRRGRNRRC